jgi:hypothetical protein
MINFVKIWNGMLASKGQFKTSKKMKFRNQISSGRFHFSSGFDEG